MLLGQEAELNLYWKVIIEPKGTAKKQIENTRLAQ